MRWVKVHESVEELLLSVTGWSAVFVDYLESKYGRVSEWHVSSHLNECPAVCLVQGTTAALPWRAWRTGALSKRPVLSVSTNLDWGDVAAGQLCDSERRRCLALHRVSSGGRVGWARSW